MTDMPMSMPGGWTMSMMWMRMPGQTWLDAGASFLGMWVVMMAAMMLPSLVPMLARYRAAAVGWVDSPRLGLLTAIVSAGYFAVWTALGVVVFMAGVALATLAMEMEAVSRAVPVAVGIVVVAGGALQFSAWKARHLACCRGASDVCCNGARDAWRHGLRLGLHCTYCCAGLTAVLLAIGVMDLRAMAAVTAAITLERLAPRGQRVARAVGAVTIGAGLCLLVQATA